MDGQREEEDERLGIPHHKRKEIESELTKCFLKNRKLYGNAGWFIGLPRTNTSIIAIFAQGLPQYAGLDVKGLYVIYQKSLIAMKKVWEKEDMKEEAASDTGPQGSAEFDNPECATNALDSTDKIEPMDPEQSGEKTFGSDVKYVNSLERVLEVADPSPAPAQDASPVEPPKGEREDSVLEPAEKGDARTLVVALKTVSRAKLDDTRRALEKRKFDCLGEIGGEIQGSNTSTKKQKRIIKKKGIARPVKRGK
ncbi:hypothetical protein BGZ57DRAFT_934801 [Hyaloscypha finlandica]|nr:hypothetical protein BGZ57DRAFT_934801 [Hyaloscypha finlandica]